MTDPSPFVGPASGRDAPRLSLVGADRPTVVPLGGDGRADRVQGVVSSSDVARFARQVWGVENPDERMRRGAALAVELVEACDHAALSLVSSGRLQGIAASDGVARRADLLQHELGEGPCLDAVRTRVDVQSEDLEHEARWPGWCVGAVDELGLRATLSLPLSDDHRTYGSLDLYSGHARTWSPRAVETAEVLATHLALALADGLQIEHRGRAMLARTIIGQAQGIVMERYGVSEAAAYATLLRISQQDHVKLGTVAADLVRTGRLRGVGDNLSTPPPAA